MKIITIASVQWHPSDDQRNVGIIVDTDHLTYNIPNFIDRSLIYVGARLCIRTYGQENEEALSDAILTDMPQESADKWVGEYTKIRMCALDLALSTSMSVSNMPPMQKDDPKSPDAIDVILSLADRYCAWLMGPRPDLR